MHLFPNLRVLISCIAYKKLGQKIIVKRKNIYSITFLSTRKKERRKKLAEQKTISVKLDIYLNTYM